MATTSSSSSSATSSGVNRMAGLMSGLDTESLVKAMASNSISRYNKKAQKLQTLQWKQEAYRSHISSLSSFKDKYLSLSSKTALSSANLSKCKTTSSNSLVTSSASSSAKAATYSITKATAATSAAVTGEKNVFNQSIGIDFSKFNTTQNLSDAQAALDSADTALTTAKQAYNVSLNDFAGYMKDYIADNGITISEDVQQKLDDLESQLSGTLTDDERYDLLNNYSNNLYNVIKNSSGGLTAFVADADYETNANALDAKLIERNSAVSAYNTAKTAYDEAVKLDNDGAGLATKISLTIDGAVNEISISATTSKEDAVNQFKTALSSINSNFDYDDATGKLTLNSTGDGIHHTFSVAANTNIGLSSTQSSDVSSLSTLSSASFKNALTPDADGNYTLNVNGTDFSFKANATISSIVDTINNAKLGVKMSFSSFNQNFKIESTTSGAGSAITLGGNMADSLFGTSENRTSTNGSDSSITISCDGSDAVTYTNKSNSYTFDGTTIDVSKLGSFESGAGVDPITVTTEKDTSNIKEFVVNFINDYNTLIEGLRDEMTTKRPKSKGTYYDPLTDEQEEEMDTDEIEKWDKMAKQGLLYQDTYLSQTLSNLQTTMGEFSGGVSLASMGIKSEKWNDYGKLNVDETKLDAYLAQNGDKVADFFTNTKSGLSKNLSATIDKAISTKRNSPGYLTSIAGVEGTTSEKKNALYSEISSLQKTVTTLKSKYESEMTSYWNRFTALESYISRMNSQASIFSSE